MAVVYLLVAIWAAAAAAPAHAGDRPPRPTAASHGVEVRTAFVGQCPRRQPRAAPDCAIPDLFKTTRPVPVHSGGVLRIDVRRRARRVQLDVDCGHRRLRTESRRRWRFEITSGGCTVGSLYVRYRHVDATYTFNLRDHVHCRPPNSKTVAENGFVRIYSREGTRDGYPETAFFACRFDSGRTQSIGRDYCGDAYDPCWYVDHVRLAGEKVAYVGGHRPDRYGRSAFALGLLDSATWRTQPRFEASSSSASGVREGYLKVTAVELKETGSLAWIADLWGYDCCHQPSNQTQTYEVRKSEETGANVLLDSGADIDPDSLALDGSTLTWTHAGEARSATLD